MLILLWAEKLGHNPSGRPPSNGVDGNVGAQLAIALGVFLAWTLALQLGWRWGLAVVRAALSADPGLPGRHIGELDATDPTVLAGNTMLLIGLVLCAGVVIPERCRILGRPG